MPPPAMPASTATAAGAAECGDRPGRSEAMRSSKEATAELRQQPLRRRRGRRCCPPPLPSFPVRGTERVYGEYAFGLRQPLLASLIGVFILLSAVFAILYFVHPMVTTLDSVSHACACGVFIVLYVFANTKYLRGRRSVLAVSYALWASLAVLGLVALPVQRLRTTVVHHFGPADGVWQCILVIYTAYLVPAVHLYAALALGAALPAAHFIAAVTLHVGGDSTDDAASAAAAAARLHRDASWRTLSANAILFLAANMMGIMTHVVCDRIRRKSFLSCRSYVERRAESQEHEHRLERLLLTMLPPHLAVDVKAALKADPDGSQVQRTYVRQHKYVSVMSATVQGLDNLKKKLSASEFVRVLSDLTTAFEQLCEKHRCLYIRASGDSFLASCGIPVFSSDGVRCSIELAFDVIQAVNLVKQAEGVNLTAFVGVHTGSVADGVVGGRTGSSRWHYECYGSDILLARHLGITSVSGKVHISEPTLQQLLPQLPAEPGSALINGYDIQKSLISHGLNVVSYFVSSKIQRPLNLVHQRLVRKLNSGDGPPSTPRPSTAPPEGESAFSRIIGRSLADDSSSSHRLIMSSLPEVVLPYSKRPPSGQSTDSGSSEQVNKMLGQAIAAGAIEQETSSCINFFTLKFKDDPMESAFSAEERSIALGLVGLLLILVCTSAVHFIALPRTMVLLVGFLFLFMVLSLLLIAVLAMKLKIVTCSALYSSVMHSVLAVLLLVLLCSASVINVFTCHGCLVPMPAFFRYGVAEAEADVTCSPPHYIYLVALLVLFGVVNFRVSYILQLVLLLLIAAAFGVVVAFTNAAGFQAYDKLPFINREAPPFGSSPTPTTAEGAPATPSTTVLGLVGIIHFVLLHFLVGRHIEWVHRVDFVWKFKEWQESGNAQQLHKSERQVIGSMLPAHVVPYYTQASLCGVSGNLPPANYSCDHHAIGVAVVTIPNFPNLMAEMEQVGQGASVIQAIDDIEAVLDELLRRDDCQVLERINVCGPMYVIASGVRNDGVHRAVEACTSCQGEPCGCTRSAFGSDDSYASALGKLLEIVLDFRTRLQLVNEGTGRTLFMRAGVAVGEAVEGVVGNAYPQYNIWGPAVDDARKLEMTCKAGHIQVSKDVTLLTKHRYHFQQRGQAVLPAVTELSPHYLLGARLQPVASDGASASSSLGHAAPRGAAGAAAAALTGSGPRQSRGSGDAASTTASFAMGGASGGQPPLPPPPHFGSGSGGAPSSSSSSAAAASTVTTVAALASVRGRTHSADSSAPSIGTPTGSVIRLEKKDSLCESVGSAGGIHARRLAAAAASSAGVASPSSASSTTVAPLLTSSLGKSRPLSPELPAVHYSKSVVPQPPPPGAAGGGNGPLVALQLRDGAGTGSGRPTVYLTQSYLTGATSAAGAGASKPPPSPEASLPIGAADVSRAEDTVDEFDQALALLDGVGSTPSLPPVPRGSCDDGDLMLKPTKVSSVPKVANVISTCSASRQTQLSRQLSGTAGSLPGSAVTSTSVSTGVAAAGDLSPVSSLPGGRSAHAIAASCAGGTGDNDTGDNDEVMSGGGSSSVALLPVRLPSPPAALPPSSSSGGADNPTAAVLGSRATAEQLDDALAGRHCADASLVGCAAAQQPLPPLPLLDVDSLASLSDMLPAEGASDLKSRSVTSLSAASLSSSRSEVGGGGAVVPAATVGDSASLQSDEPSPLPPPSGDWLLMGDVASQAQPQLHAPAERGAANVASPTYYVLEPLAPPDRQLYAPFASGGGASYDDVIRRGPAVSHARIAPARVGGGSSFLPPSEAAPAWLSNATGHFGMHRGTAAASSDSTLPPFCDRNGGTGGYGDSDLSDDEQHPLMQLPWDVSEQRTTAGGMLYMPSADRRARIGPAATAADMCWPVANKFTSKLQRLHESRGRQNVRDLYSELESDAADCESVVSADETDFESDAAPFSAGAGAKGRGPPLAATGWNRTAGSDQRRLPTLDGERRRMMGSDRPENGFASAASATRLPPDALASSSAAGISVPLRQSCSMECLPSDSEDCAAAAAAYAAAAAAAGGGGVGSQLYRPSSRQAAATAAYFAQLPARRRRYCLDDRGSVVSTSSWLGSELSRSDPYLSYDESEYDNCRPSAATGLLTSDDDLLESDDRPAAISESDLYQLNIDFSRFRFADAAAAAGLPDYISTLERRIRARQGQRSQHQQHVVTDV